MVCGNFHYTRSVSGLIFIIKLTEQYNMLGVKNENYKQWKLPNGTKVLVADKVVTFNGDDGYIYAYPQGDTNVAPSVRMSQTGLYFDPVLRQEDLSKKECWNAKEDYKDQYTIYSDEELEYFRKLSIELYENTDYALVGNYWNGGIGDNLHLPGPWVKNPKGVRDLAEFFMMMYDRPNYVREFYELQTDIAIENFKLYYEAVGNRIEVMCVTGTDFGTQSGLMISPDMYREMYKPYHQKMNQWIHKNTKWKTFMHSCGAIKDLIPDIIEAEFDILNPVQVSAKGMNPKELKNLYGEKLVFWGGACDAQSLLPNATPEEVYTETKKNAEILSKGGGYIGGNVHNLQYGVPPENFIAEVKALLDTKVSG